MPESLASEAHLLASKIQHTLISNALTRGRWEQHISECREYGFHAAMVPPSWVKSTSEALRGTGIRTVSWIDFPLGTMTSAIKTCEARHLVEEGAEELDLMPNVGFLLSGMEKEFFADIAGAVAAAGTRPVKVILELPLLSSTERLRAVDLAIQAGAAYLKNVSGGAVGVATVEDIRFLRNVAPSSIKIKASGGIKTTKQVKELLAAGADLIGSSAGAAIIRHFLGVCPQDLYPAETQPGKIVY